MEGFDKLHEECGVFGVWDEEKSDIAKEIYYGLISLQHRGQESAGIAVCSTWGPRGNISVHKDMGLVSEVFNEEKLETMVGNIGIGHVRYSTTGASSIENVQPVTSYYLKGTLGLVHNGNIVNTAALKQELMEAGYTFKATTDTEVIHVLLSRLRAESGSIEQAVEKAIPKLIGGYALIIMSPRKLIAVRDPYGLKPMCIGKTDTGYVIASESCALHAVKAEFVRDVEPGEIITFSKNGMKSNRDFCHGRVSHCIFEYIYFARLDSKMDGISIYDARFKGGRALAKVHPVEADVVTGVPESGIVSAMGYAEESGIPFKLCFNKNSYIGRTFIKPTQKERISAVHMKLNVLASVVKDKRVVLIDDSIVRGTTISNLIKMMRKAGAKEVHVRISSPPFLHPCYYGTDVPDIKELIATKMSIAEIREKIGADTLDYMSVDALDDMVEGLPVCKACFNNVYPTITIEE